MKIPDSSARATSTAALETRSAGQSIVFDIILSDFQEEEAGGRQARRLPSVAGALVDDLFKVFALFATVGAELLQSGELLLGLFHSPGLDVEFAQIFPRRFMVRIEFERLGVIGVGRL